MIPPSRHRVPTDVRVIGYGAGVTARSGARLDEAQRIDLVEIERAVIDASPYSTTPTAPSSNPPVDRRRAPVQWSYREGARYAQMDRQGSDGGRRAGGARWRRVPGSFRRGQPGLMRYDESDIRSAGLSKVGDLAPGLELQRVDGSGPVGWPEAAEFVIDAYLSERRS